MLAAMMMRAGLSVLFVVCLPQSQATPVDYGCKDTPLSANCRWLYPCSGSELLEFAVEEMEEEFVPESNRDLDHRLVHTASDCRHLKSYVEKLLRNYIRKRFGSESAAKTIEEHSQDLSAFQPKLTSHSLTDLTLSQTVLFGYEDLSKFSIILDRMRIEEANEVDVDVVFDVEFSSVESSVYTILCKLVELMSFLEISLPSDAKDDVRAVELPSAPRKSIRHDRDFVNLRHLETTLKSAASAIGSFVKPKKH